MESPSVEHYDFVSLGSGEAGKYIAWTLASTRGKRCAVIERKWFGGSCPNVACLPSKNVIHSAKVHSLHSHAEDFGLSKCGNEGHVDMKAVKKRKDDMIDGLMQMHDANFKKNKVDVVWGEGRFTELKTIEVTDADGKRRILKGDIVVICTGSRAVISDVPGLKEANPLTHVEMLSIEEVPDHLIILGGGYIGLEFSQAMKRFGAKVTVIEHNERILKREDDDVAKQLQEVLEKEGVEFLNDTSINEVTGESGGSVIVKGPTNGQPLEISGSHILCATGRRPNTENIGLELAGVKVSPTGFIEVDEWNRTTEDGVFAVGDCSGSPHFTHVAFDDFRIVVEYLSGKGSEDQKRRSVRQIPFTLFTDPELAHVGLREHELKARGTKYRSSKIPMAAFLRTRTLGETTGFAKVMVSAEDDTILGFTAIGPGVGELLPVVQLAMRRGLPYTDIASLVITHPTLSEGLVALFSAVPPHS
jgi:pyruvate/2-oxoglutarate dehydrogenase complex dihydrolipoamide dehydrogenase (E3) component